MKFNRSVKNLLSIAILGLTAQIAHASNDPHSIVFGVAPGPYGELVKLAIEPGLEKKVIM